MLKFYKAEKKPENYSEKKFEKEEITTQCLKRRWYSLLDSSHPFCVETDDRRLHFRH